MTVVEYRCPSIRHTERALPRRYTVSQMKCAPQAPHDMPNGFLEALYGLFQAAKRKTRGYRRLSTLRAILFLISGKLNFCTLNIHAA